MHNIPSGIFHKDKVNFIGNGVVFDATTFKREVDAISKFNVAIEDKLYIARKVHLILPTHKLLDTAKEAAKGKQKIGSTLANVVYV